MNKKKLFLICWAILIAIGLFRAPDMRELSVNEHETMMTMAPLIIAAMVIAILTIIIVARIRHKGPEPLPSHPASARYNLAIKLFSTFAFFVVLALCFFSIMEQLQGTAGTSPATVKSTTTYVRTYFLGIKLGTLTSPASSSSIPDKDALMTLGILFACAVSMLVLCVDDWRRTFGLPNKKRLQWALCLGFTGGGHFLSGNRIGGMIRLGGFLLGCLFCWLGLAFGTPVLAFGLLIIVFIWSREIVNAANEAQLPEVQRY